VNSIPDPHGLLAAIRKMKNNLRHRHAVFVGEHRAVQQVNALHVAADLMPVISVGKKFSYARRLNAGNRQPRIHAKRNAVKILHAVGNTENCRTTPSAELV